MRMYRRSAILQALTNGLSNQANNSQANFVPRIIPVPDTNSNLVTFLTHFDSTTQDVISGSVATGTPIYDTLSPLFGLGSLVVNTSANEIVYPTSNYGFVGDFTVEATIFPTSADLTLGSYDTHTVVNAGSAYSTNTWWLCYSYAQDTMSGYYKKFSFHFRTPAWDGFTLLSTHQYEPNQEYEIEVNRQGNTVRIFVNGVLDGTTTFAGDMSVAGILRVGGFTSYSNRSLKGRVDELRLTNGLARDITDYAVQTGPFANPGPIIVDIPYYAHISLTAKRAASIITLGYDGEGDAISTSAIVWNSCRLDTGINSGKYFFEIKAMPGKTDLGYVGLISGTSTNFNCATASAIGSFTGSVGFSPTLSNNSQTSGLGNIQTGWPTTTIGNQVYGFALDMDAKTLSLYNDGVFVATILTNIVGTVYPAVSVMKSTGGVLYNTGDGGWWSVCPDGFNAIPNLDKSSGDGYFAGGRTSVGLISYITGVNFATEAVGTTAATTSIGHLGGAGHQSLNDGYISGGISAIAGTTATNKIDKINFATKSGIQLSSMLLQACYNTAGLSSPNNGYVCGGYGGGTAANNIVNKLMYSTEVNNSILYTLGRATSGEAGIYDQNFGYVCGGYGNNLKNNAIDSINFATDAVVTISNTLSLNKTTATGVVADYNGYICGGTTTTIITTIEKFDFSTLAVTLASAVLSGVTNGAGGASSATKGYIAGGYANSAYTTKIDAYNFRTETCAALAVGFATGIERSVGVQSS